MSDAPSQSSPPYSESVLPRDMNERIEGEGGGCKGPEKDIGGEVISCDSAIEEVSVCSVTGCTSSCLGIGGAEEGIEMGLLARERGSSSE